MCSRQPLTKTLFSSDSMLCQVNNQINIKYNREKWKCHYMQPITFIGNLRNPNFIKCSIQTPHNWRPHWKYVSFTASTEPVAFTLGGTDFRQGSCSRGHHEEQALRVMGRKSRLRVLFWSLNIFLDHHLPLSSGVCKMMIGWIQRVWKRWSWSQLPSLCLRTTCISMSTHQLMPMRTLTCLWVSGNGQSWIRRGFLTQED